MKDQPSRVSGRAATIISALVLAAFGSVTAATAAVIEYYNPDLDHYFITADPVEQDFVETGAVGRWELTGNAFAAGGPDLVCRFYGNSNTNPATGTFYGPNSHFYTANPAECEGLKAQYTPNAKSWKFESNDFATTIAANGGCPASLVPVYRAYNNGFARGVDSNHRITDNLDDYQRTIDRGWIGEGIVMCAPGRPAPAATSVGTPIGSATTATIGAAGGTLATPDGKIRLTIPAGALAADTVIGIQQTTNPAPGGLGNAYQLTPEGLTFLKPITVTFEYTDANLIGTAAEFLHVAFQTAEGLWQLAEDPVLDAAAKTVSVSTSHFSGWTIVKGLQIDPPSKTVRVNASVGLEVVSCTTSRGFPVIYFSTGCVTQYSLPIRDWSVNGKPGGGSVFGTVSGRGATATYLAPANEPIPNTVAVSAVVLNSVKGKVKKTTVVSNITIVGQRWEGLGIGNADAYVATADVIWSLESGQNGISTYVPNGTVKVEFDGCTLSPDTVPVSQKDGYLRIDYNADPPTYEGFGVTVWSGVVTCPPGGKANIAVNALFFAGRHQPGNLAKGTVDTVQGGRMLIRGADDITDGENTIYMSWFFERKDEPPAGP